MGINNNIQMFHVGKFQTDQQSLSITVKSIAIDTLPTAIYAAMTLCIGMMVKME